MGLFEGLIVMISGNLVWEDAAGGVGGVYFKEE
jgi:hypothetical protein